MSTVILSKEHCVQHMEASKKRLESTLDRLKAALGKGQISEHYQQLEVQHQVVVSLLHHLQQPAPAPADFSKVLVGGCTGQPVHN